MHLAEAALLRCERIIDVAPRLAQALPHGATLRATR